MASSPTGRTRLAALAVMSGALCAGFASAPALAAPLGDELSASAPVAVTPAVDADSERLHALIGTQTQHEIMAIVNSEAPSYAYYDIETDTYLAAFTIEAPNPWLQGRAITQRGPGCGTGDACAFNASYKYGYYGTGQKNISLSKITKISAGTKNTTWWFTATKGINLTPNVVREIAPTAFYSITRS